MWKRAAISLLVGGYFLVARPAWAPFHRMVIDQVFWGVSGSPDAQYVQLRTLASGQVFVNEQTIRAQSVDGSDAGTFATFTRNLTGTPGSGVRILAGTRTAEDLFCVPMDQLADGRLALSDGRVCFGLLDGPVTCLAYGQFTGDNSGFGQPAAAPELGQALTRVNLSGMCSGGMDAGAGCNVDSDCRAGSCVYEDNARDFATAEASPQNTKSQMGHVDGTPGDPDGTGVVSIGELADEVATLFEASKRCDLADPARRGADANIDTRIGAADVTATIRIALPGAA